MIYAIKGRSLIWGGAVGVFALLLAVDPGGSLSAAKDAMALAGRAVIPALFPFFVCSELLVALGVVSFLGRLLNPIMRPLFNVSGSGGLAMVLGLISGYPAGAKVAADLTLSGDVSQDEGERLLAFCNNSGPLFVLGAVGAGMLGRPDLGMLLYLSHFLSSITVGILFGLNKRRDCYGNVGYKSRIVADLNRMRECSPKENKGMRIKTEKGFGELLGNAVKNAAETVIVISGYVVLFNILIQSLHKMGLMGALGGFGEFAQVIEAAICGFLEPANGARAASGLFEYSPMLSLIMLSAVIGWAGISVHLQVLAIIAKAGLSSKRYFAGKLLQSVIAPLYTYILVRLMPVDVPVFMVHDSFMHGRVDLFGMLSTGVFFAFLGLVAVIIFTGAAGVVALLERIFGGMRGRKA